MQAVIKNTFFEVVSASRVLQRSKTADTHFFFESSLSSCSTIGNMDSSRSPSVKEDEPAFTTVMIRNIPNHYQQEHLIAEISAKDMEIDFLSLPQTKYGKGNRSYAFVNFVSASDAKRFIEEFDGHRFTDQSPKNTKYAVCSIAKLQGFENNLNYSKRAGSSAGLFINRK